MSGRWLNDYTYRQLFVAADELRPEDVALVNHNLALLLLALTLLQRKEW